MTSIAAVIKNTTTVSVNTITLGKDDFHILPLRERRLPFSNASFPIFEIEKDFVPITVIHWFNDRFTDDDLKRIVADFTARDDVWTKEFLRGDIICDLLSRV